ncbi:MAG: class I SAM-dependent methyltransferase, partial [Candidatus Nanoarchaeia archaeon]
EVEERGERVVIIDPEHYKELPYKSLKNKQEWELRKVNFETLMKHLREDNRKRILDLGSGSCWLSNKLADYYEVFALDINSGPTGLEISDIYFEDGKYFERVQGEITNLPIADKSMDVVILSAALSEYTPGVVIGEITRVLKEDGIMYIFDSKVYNTQEGAERAIDGEGSFYPLFKKDLDKELRNMYDIKYFFPNYGRWWGMSKYITSLVTRKEYPSYPIIRAQKR